MALSSMWVTMALNTVLMLVKDMVKNPEKKASYKSALLNLRDAITIVYDETEIEGKPSSELDPQR